MGTGAPEQILIGEASKILIGQGILGFFVFAELIAIVVLFKMMIQREDKYALARHEADQKAATLEHQHSERLAGQSSQCMACIKEHDKRFNEMVDEFGQRLGSVYTDMRTEATNLRGEAIKMQEATTSAIIRTGDSLNTVTNLLNRLIGMLARYQNGIGGE